jgi:hypothetical protein
VAPTDARRVFGLNDRPRGPDRLLRRWSAHRTEAFFNLAVEQVVGVTAGAPGVPATLVLAGQGYARDGTSEAWACVVGLDPDTGAQRWQRALPFGDEPEPFGEALLTQTEAWVPTARGIARFALADGKEAPSVEPSLVPEDRARLLDAEEMLFGNLVPAPGQGILAVGADGLVLWAFRQP